MVVTLGSAGSVYYDSITGDAGHCPAHRVEMRFHRCGRRLLSGVVSGLTRRSFLSKAVAAGPALPPLTIQSDEACCPSTGFLEGDDPMKKLPLAAARRLFDGQVITMLVCAVLFTLCNNFSPRLRSDPAGAYRHRLSLCRAGSAPHCGKHLGQGA